LVLTLHECDCCQRAQHDDPQRNQFRIIHSSPP
jgi:hypothetical protein